MDAFIEEVFANPPTREKLRKALTESARNDKTEWGGSNLKAIERGGCVAPPLVYIAMLQKFL